MLELLLVLEQTLNKIGKGDASRSQNRTTSLK